MQARHNYVGSIIKKAASGALKGAAAGAVGKAVKSKPAVNIGKAAARGAAAGAMRRFMQSHQR